MNKKIIDTGLLFAGHRVLLGPNIITHAPADKSTLLRLDGFLKRHFPDWYEICKKGNKLYGQRIK